MLLKSFFLGHSGEAPKSPGLSSGDKGKEKEKEKEKEKAIPIRSSSADRTVEKAGGGGGEGGGGGKGGEADSDDLADSFIDLSSSATNHAKRTPISPPHPRPHTPPF